MWPKTEKEGRWDEEERVLDHRTVHRFLRPEEERRSRKVSGLIARGESVSVRDSVDEGRSYSEMRKVNEVGKKGRTIKAVANDEGTKGNKRKRKSMVELGGHEEEMDMEMESGRRSKRVRNLVERFSL